MHDLDVGGGLGGPARTIASEFGCTVEVLDLTDEFCRAGQALTLRTGLEGRVSYQKRLAATPGDPSPLGPQLVFRHDFEEMLRNQVLNLSEDRIVMIQSLFER